MLMFKNFGGEVPRLTKRDLPNNQAQVAESLYADTPEFRPLPEDVDHGEITVIAGGATCKTMLRYPTDSETLIGTELELSVVRSPIAADTQDRVYIAQLSSQVGELPPYVLRGADLTVSSNFVPLGVPKPAAPTLAIGSPSQTILSPSETAANEKSLMTQIRAIVISMGLEDDWNPNFDLGSRAGFRQAPNEGGLIYQRVFGVQAASATSDITPDTWVTFNGTDVARHAWITEVPNMPFIHYSPAELPFMTGSGSANRAYYGNFPAKVRFYKIKADVTAERTALLNLDIPGTTDPLMSEAEVDQLIANLRAIFPNDPTTSSVLDIQNNLQIFQSSYNELVSYLSNGFESSITPATGFATVAQAQATLQAAASIVGTVYREMFDTKFEEVLIDYFDETRFTSRFATGETELEEPRIYVVTYVNQWGEESEPSDPSELIEPNQYEPVVVTLPAASSIETGTYFVTERRIYRTATGSISNYQLVTTLPVATLSYTDAKKTEALNETIPTFDSATGELWSMPPSISGKYLRHLVSMPGGFLAGFIENNLYFSVPYHPYAWPAVYQQTCDFDIVALGVFGNTLVVLTKGGPEYVSGDSPSSMSKVKLESNEVCQSPRSVVPVAGGVLFASQNGLCVATQSGINVLTASLWTREEWRALEPENLICEEFNGSVYMTHTGGLVTAVLHVPTMKLVRIPAPFRVTAWYSDLYAGQLYAAAPPVGVAKPHAIRLLDGEGVRTAKWRSKRIVVEKETGFAWLRVEGAQSTDEPLTVKVYGYIPDDVETETLIEGETGDGTYTALLTNTKPVRLGVGRFKDFEVEISGKCRITSVQLVSSTAELQGVA